MSFFHTIDPLKIHARAIFAELIQAQGLARENLSWQGLGPILFLGRDFLASLLLRQRRRTYEHQHGDSPPLLPSLHQALLKDDSFPECEHAHDYGGDCRHHEKVYPNRSRRVHSYVTVIE